MKRRHLWVTMTLGSLIYYGIKRFYAGHLDMDDMDSIFAQIYWTTATLALHYWGSIATTGAQHDARTSD